MRDDMKLFGNLKWLCFVPGLLMYVGTEYSFGGRTASVLAVTATISFWLLVRSAEGNRLSRMIAKTVRDAITLNGEIDHIIEIRKLRMGYLARIYLLNAGERFRTVNDTINAHIREDGLKEKVCAIQIVDIRDAKEMPELQKRLNKQLFRYLMGMRSKGKK